NSSALCVSTTWPPTLGSLALSDLRRVLRSIFATRRKADAILEGVGPERFGAAVDDLIHGEGVVTDRFAAFDAVLADHPEPGFDLPSELLHFTAPDRWWLWTRWMWDPRAGTGALPLVTVEEFDFDAPNRAEGYLRVGEAMAFVNETGKAVGFTDLGSGLFGADVFL